jgi:Tfp pilus assembly protein PilN
MPLAPGLVKDGLILQPKAVGEAIDALFKSVKVAKGQVITSLTGLSITYCILNLPRMKPALLEEAILRGARKEIPLPLEELYLSWQAIGGRHEELNFFVLGVPRNLIDAVVQTLTDIGVKPYLIDLKPLALARAANRGDAIVVDLEPDCFDIVLVANGIPTIVHTVTPRGEGATLEDNILRLTDGISKTVNFYNNSHPEAPLSLTTPLLLAGELSADATAGQLIQAQMEYPVEPLVPPLKFPPELPVALYTSNMGLALKEMPQETVPEGDATRFQDINLDILSGKYRTRARRVPMRYKLLSLALIIAIGLLFPLYYFKSQVAAENTLLQTELDGISQELSQARLVFNEAQQIDDTINEILAAVDALQQEYQDILSRGGDFTDYLRVVTNVLPSSAYFTSIVIGTNQILVEGEADRYLTVISYATALLARPELSEVRIAEIGESGSAGLSFTIIIDK